MKLFMIALTAMLLVGCGNNNQAPTTEQNANTSLYQNSEVEALINNNTNTTNNQTNNGITNQTNTNSINQTNNGSVINTVETNTQDLTLAQQTYQKITNGMNLNTVDMSVEQVRDLYKLDPTVLKSCVVRTTTDGTTPTEIAIFELDNNTSNDSVILSIEDRIEALNEQWGNPTVQMATQDRVIVFVMSPQADQLISNFSQ